MSEKATAQRIRFMRRIMPYLEMLRPGKALRLQQNAAGDFADDLGGDCGRYVAEIL